MADLPSFSFTGDVEDMRTIADHFWAFFVIIGSAVTASKLVLPPWSDFVTCVIGGLYLWGYARKPGEQERMVESAATRAVEKSQEGVNDGA